LTAEGRFAALAVSCERAREIGNDLAAAEQNLWTSG
jgi:hypothetical protein